MNSKDITGVLPGTRPIFVSGVYRSGTTFISALLGSHPKLFATSSTVKFLRFCFLKYGDLKQKDNLANLLDDTSMRLKKRWQIDIDFTSIKNKYENKSIGYADIYDSIMRLLLCSEMNTDCQWVDKLAVQWSSIPEFLEMFPQGKVVHTIRDPRDVVSSYKALTFEPGKTYLDAAINCRSSMEFISSLPPQYASRVLAVKVEDFSRDPEKLIATLFNFLELPATDSLYDPSKYYALGEDWTTNTSFDDKFDKIPKPASRWKEHLDKTDLFFTEWVTQPYLSRYGYESSGIFPSRNTWNDVYSIFEDDFLKARVENILFKGKGSEGYRTDPYTHEMKIVFPERYKQL